MKLVNLIPLNEIDFPNQKSFDAYNKKHKLRPDTEVTVAGRKTTAGRAALNTNPVKGTSVFGNDGNSKEVDSKKFPFTVTYLDNDGNRKVADNFVSKRDAQRFRITIDPKHKAEVIPTEDLNKPSVDIKSLFKNISKLTDINNHNEAAMELAKFTGDKTYIEQMEKIQKYHDKNGSMPQSLIQYRSAIVGNLLSQISKKYGEKVGKQISKAF